MVYCVVWIDPTHVLTYIADNIDVSCVYAYKLPNELDDSSYGLLTWFRHTQLFLPLSTSF